MPRSRESRIRYSPPFKVFRNRRNQKLRQIRGALPTDASEVILIIRIPKTLGQRISIGFGIDACDRIQRGIELRGVTGDRNAFAALFAAEAAAAGRAWHGGERIFL